MRRLPASVMTASIILMAPVPTLARPIYARPSVEERDLARCIEQSAHGKRWLARTLWGLWDQEGGWVGAAVPNSNGTDDLGPLQVNSWWSGRIAELLGRTPVEVRRWLQFDACFNVDAARWIFLSALTVTQDYWKAIGVYHSPVGWRQTRYSRLVAGHLLRRFGPTVFAPVGH